MIRFLTLIFLVAFALPIKAEKQYKRSFPLRELALEIAESELVGSNDLLTTPDTPLNIEKFKPEFKKYLKKKVHDYFEETSIEVDEEKKLVHITSNLKTMYQVMNLVGDHYSDAAQLKFHLTVIEVEDTSELLKIDPVTVKAKTIRKLPKNQRKIISELDLFTQNGNTSYIKSKNNIIEITPQIDPDGYSIEVEMRTVIKEKYTYTHDTRFKFFDRSELAFQIQPKDNEKRRNLFLLVSVVLLDYNLQPLERFTKKEVETVRDQIMKNNELKGKLLTRFYTLSVGMSSGGEEEREEYKPDFKGYFIQNDIPFTDEESVTFVQGAMRLVIKAKESTHQKIEKHLKDIGIETPQRKVVLRVYEIDNKSFEKLNGSKPKFLDLNKLKSIKFIDNFELFAVSGKTAVVTESDLSGKKNTVGFDVTSQSNLKDTETDIDLKLVYQKNGISAKMERCFSIKNGDYNFFELQRKRKKTIFIAIYADRFVAESENWFGN